MKIYTINILRKNKLANSVSYWLTLELAVNELTAMIKSSRLQKVLITTLRETKEY